MKEFLSFGLRQARSSIFGALLLAGILATGFWYPADAPIARYDLLFAYAIAIQFALLAFRLESLREFGVVILFHALATAMELFKTSDRIGSWAYPGDAVIRLGNVPLFAGFLYSAVGSYMARVWRLLDLRFERFPPLAVALSLAVLSYANFFAHHFLVDIRWLLIALAAWFFRATIVIYRPLDRDRRMPLLLGFLLVAIFIWIAENIGTFARVWIYPNQRDGWNIVGFGKLTSWFLLMQLSFILIYALRRVEYRLEVQRRSGATH